MDAVLSDSVSFGDFQQFAHGRTQLVRKVTNADLFDAKIALA